jgi:hypothetical protein
MLELNEQINELKALIRTEKKWHLWIISYGISHHYMELALHEGDFPNHYKLGCRNCDFWQGSLQGGPYLLEIDILETHGQQMIEVRSTDGSLRFVCGWLKVINRRSITNAVNRDGLGDGLDTHPS